MHVVYASEYKSGGCSLEALLVLSATAGMAAAQPTYTSIMDVLNRTLSLSNFRDLVNAAGDMSVTLSNPNLFKGTGFVPNNE
jgi:hypothetical protein